MTVLLVRNAHPDAGLPEVHFDIKTGIFHTEDGQSISRSDLMSDGAFTHPILHEKTFTPTPKGRYNYVYRDYADLILVLRYLYATLLQVDDPADFSVRIRPARSYLLESARQEFYFSCHPRKVATQRLSVHQINAMFSEIYGFPFEYGNQIILDKKITHLDLLPMLDADNLYQKPEMDPTYFQHQIRLDHFELRYLNHEIGFGVFARAYIPAGEVIARYNGKFVSHDVEFTNYSFLPQKDNGFNLLLDAANYGNLARFINHAPKLEETHLNPKTFLHANVAVRYMNWCGNNHVMFVANRNIACGEQILCSYGKKYFKHHDDILGIKKNGTVFDPKRGKIKDTLAQKKRSLSTFARYDIQYAKWLLVRRMLCAMVLCFGIGLISRCF